MFVIGNSHKIIYEKKMYCTKVKMSAKWYIFILSDMLLCDAEIDKHYTKYCVFQKTSQIGY